MSHVWIADEEGTWSPTELEHETYLLSGSGLTDPAETGTPPADPDLPRLHRVTNGQSAWAVMHSPEAPLWLNGDVLPAGIRLLTDRDELLFRPGGDIPLVRVYFSTEALAQVQHFPEGMKSTVCPRCKQRLDEGDEAVRCPACGMWHHQREDRQCWTYAEHCAMCDCGTDLDQGYRWTPEEL